MIGGSVRPGVPARSVAARNSPVLSRHPDGWYPNVRLNAACSFSSGHANRVDVQRDQVPEPAVCRHRLGQSNGIEAPKSRRVLARAVAIFFRWADPRAISVRQAVDADVTGPSSPSRWRRTLMSSIASPHRRASPPRRPAPDHDRAAAQGSGRPSPPTALASGRPCPPAPAPRQRPRVRPPRHHHRSPPGPPTTRYPSPSYCLSARELEASQSHESLCRTGTSVHLHPSQPTPP